MRTMASRAVEATRGDRNPPRDRPAPQVARGGRGRPDLGPRGLDCPQGRGGMDDPLLCSHGSGPDLGRRIRKGVGAAGAVDESQAGLGRGRIPQGPLRTRIAVLRGGLRRPRPCAGSSVTRSTRSSASEASPCRGWEGTPRPSRFSSISISRPRHPTPNSMKRWPDPIWRPSGWGPRPA